MGQEPPKPDAAAPKKKKEETYNDAFPALAVGSALTPGKEMNWTKVAAGMTRIKPTDVSISFNIASSDRRWVLKHCITFGYDMLNFI